MNLLVSGGAGFIGSNVIRRLIDKPEIERLVNLDCLTYAGHLENLSGVDQHSKYVFEKTDLRDKSATFKALKKHCITHVMHLAAESHVDRSITGPADFIQTNVIGTFHLLEACRALWWTEAKAEKRKAEKRKSEASPGVGSAGVSPAAFGVPPKDSSPSTDLPPLSSDVSVSAFCFVHISTDEVYGSLGPTGTFTESSPYAPNSPYAASKAASDMLVRAYHHTYGLPAIITHCSNNYGPYQYPEKLIPVVIQSVLAQKPIPVYGDGLNVRDWLDVRDHADALWLVLREGRVGESYNIGSQNEWTNLRLVELICDLMDELAPHLPANSRRLIQFVEDRPGHDRRYALDASKIQRELGWKPAHDFQIGLRETIQWYLKEYAEKRKLKR
ncbi:MAG TPA: dTDP-glucose 4,6-dehydratase [Verrucomicrobiae bacterium]